MPEEDKTCQEVSPDHIDIKMIKDVGIDKKKKKKKNEEEKIIKAEVEEEIVSEKVITKSVEFCSNII